MASVLGPAFFQFGAAEGHTYQMIVNHNFSPGNAGIIYWTDWFLPLIGFMFLFLARKNKMDNYTTTTKSNFAFIKGASISFIREKLTMLNVIPTKDLTVGNNGDIIRVAGLVLVRQRPGTAGGICFITIEDETGNANLVVFKNLFENIYRKKYCNQNY